MKACQLCGKLVIIGKSGAHKHGGKWAMRAPKHRKIWRPNLHKARIKINGNFKTMILCTKCLRKFKKETKSKEAKVSKLVTPSSTAGLSP